MRISTTQVFQSGIAAMQRDQVALDHTNLRMATGRSILTPADDPGGASQFLRLDTTIAATEQYQRNADTAKAKLEPEESNLNAVQNALQRARELVLEGNNGSQDAQSRSDIADGLRSIREEILSIANAKDANGEYVFAGTRSNTQPFVTGEQGKISYVGANGEGAVRTVAISDSRQLTIGDTGADVFMNISESSGLSNEVLPAPTNQGNLTVSEVSVADLTESLSNAGKTFRIRFTTDATTGSMQYQVYDSDNQPVQDNDGHLIGGTYIPNQTIEFAGRKLLFSGQPTAPANGDEFISRPVKQVSMFQTLDDIITAFTSPVINEEARAHLQEAGAAALSNLDAGLNRLNDIRASVGLRLAAIDDQTNLNGEYLVNLKTAASDVRDLDYSEAISLFNQQQTVLQAAQQTYVQVARLSLFNFLT